MDLPGEHPADEATGHGGGEEGDRTQMISGRGGLQQTRAPRDQQGHGQEEAEAGVHVDEGTPPFDRLRERGQPQGAVQGDLEGSATVEVTEKE